MSVTIGSNINSLSALRQLGQASEKLATSLERLSSGMRINRASDDAAGLSVSASIGFDSRVYTQAIRNANDSISVFNIASGAVGELTNLLTRLKELSAESANGTFSLAQRRTIDTEAASITDEYNRIINSTSFNGRKLLDGTLGQLTSQVGYGFLSSSIGQSLSRTTGSGTFTDQSTSSGAASRTTIAVGDINGDGKLDNISGAVLTLTSSRIYIQTGNGNGTFSSDTTATVNISTLQSLSLQDVNGDGQLDIVAVGDYDTGGGVGPFIIKSAVLLGNGNGTFGAATYTTLHSSGAFDDGFTSATYGDVNGDGKLDIITSITDGGTGGQDYLVALGTGTGSFTPQTAVATNNLERGLKLYDLNGDGKLDLISADSSSGNVNVRYGNGNGTFQTAASYSAGNGATAVAVGDLNHDGIYDLVVGASAGTLNVLLGNSNGTFQSKVSYTAASSSPNQVILADLNNDGNLDVVTDKQTFLGNSDGTFAAGVTRTTATRSLPYSSDTQLVASGDANGDGVVDVIQLDSDNKVHAELQSTASSDTIERFNLLTQSGARSTLDSLESYLSKVANEIGTIGSSQSRMNAALANLSAARENYQAAYSRIMDADIASESAELVRNRILQQTSAAVLAQANIQPQVALSLLKNI